MYPTSTGGRYVAVLSMMMGVLVIAFPVSVFSELWAEELSGAKGFEHISDTTQTNKNKNMRENEVESCSGHEILLPSPREETLRIDSKNKHQVVLNQTDINELRSCLDLIREREQRIRVILSTLDTNY